MFDKKELIPLLFVCSFFISSATYAAAEPLREVYCFLGGDHNNVKLEFVEYTKPDGKWSGGYVEYGKSGKLISIVGVKFSSEQISGANQDLSESTWLEVGMGGISGKYVMTSQGTRINDFYYQNNKNGKKFQFSDNTGNLIGDDGECHF